MTVFALTMVAGPSWDAARPRREQERWDEHAEFMDSLVDDGFVLLGGPIGDGERVLLVVEAEGERAARARLEEDPWLELGILRVGKLQPWTIWLDGRRAATSSSLAGLDGSGASSR